MSLFANIVFGLVCQLKPGVSHHQPCRRAANGSDTNVIVFFPYLGSGTWQLRRNFHQDRGRSECVLSRFYVLARVMFICYNRLLTNPCDELATIFATHQHPVEQATSLEQFLG